MIPRAMWGANVRREVGAATWNRVRRAVYRRAGYRCEVCATRGELHCHEVWSFERRTATQRLIGLAAECVDCHAVRHIGRSRTMNVGGRAIRHLCHVNGWTRQEAERHIAQALSEWRNCPIRHWRLDLSALAELPEAAGIRLPRRRTLRF